MKLVLSDEEIRQAVAEYISRKMGLEIPKDDITLVGNFENKLVEAECVYV